MGWYDAVIEVTFDASHAFDANDAFLHRFVSEHGTADAIAGGKDAFDDGFEAVVDRNESPWVSFQSDGFQSQLVGGRCASGCQQHAITFD